MNVPGNVLVAAWLLVAGLGRAQDPAPVAAAGEPFAVAVQHYRAGRFAEALAGFQALAAELGVRAAPELLGNLALAALRLQRPADAEPAARRLLEHADAEQRALGEFLLGHAAWQRCARAEAAAKLQDAEPAAWNSAVLTAETALQHWVAADAQRAGWPEALRNAERAAQRLAGLQQARATAERNKPPPKKEPDRPEPKPVLEPDQPPEVQDPTMVQGLMSTQDVAKLLARLQQKERDKRLLRQSGQRAAAVAGERDW